MAEEAIAAEFKSEVSESQAQTQKEQPQAPEHPPAQRRGIALTETGRLAPVNHHEAWGIAKTFLDSGALPQAYKNVAQVFMAQQFLRGLTLDPIVCIRQVCMINGSLTIWGELPLAVCYRSGKLEWIDEKFYDDKYNEICFANKNLLSAPVYAVCRALRKGAPAPVERVFSLEDAKRAGLLNKKGPWADYRPRMLQMKARGWALKDTCPDALMGVTIAEYDHDVMISDRGEVIGEVSNSGALAKEINNKFLKAVEETNAPQESGAAEGSGESPVSDLPGKE